MHLEDDLRLLAASARLMADAPNVDRRAALTGLSECIDDAAEHAAKIEAWASDVAAGIALVVIVALLIAAPLVIGGQP